MDRKLAQRAATAAHAGDLDTVRAAVAKDAAMARHWSLLMNACFGGQPDVVAFLIGEGADVNLLAPNAHRYRPLHRTVEHKRTMPKTPGHTAVVRLLLAHGADPMLRGSWHLHSAVAVAAFGCTEFLPAAAGARAARAGPVHGGRAGAERGSRGDPGRVSGRRNAGRRRLPRRELATIAVLCPHRGRQRAGAGRHGLPCCSTMAPTPRPGWTTPAGRTTAGSWSLLLERGGRLGDDDTVNHLACDGQVDVRPGSCCCATMPSTCNGTRGTEHHGGYNPLGCAVNMRSLKGVTWFLDRGCDPNEVQSKSGETALHVAVNSGDWRPAWCACWCSAAST